MKKRFESNYATYLKMLPFAVVLGLVIIGVGQCRAQVAPEYNDGNPRYQKVIEVNGASAANIYKMVNKWVAVTYTDAKTVIAATIENEMIKCNGVAVGLVNLGMNARFDFSYSFTIDIKDGKARFTLSPNMVGSYSFLTYIYKKDGTERTNYQANKIRESVDPHVNGLIASLEKSFNEASKDW